jgi:AcrR family transcriptional regulator
MLTEVIDFKELMIEARRSQILRGAARVFAKKGFHKATTKEIAQAAGISEGTIYNYFSDKHELLIAMLDLFEVQSLRSNILEHPPADIREFLTALMQDRYQLLQERGFALAPIIAEIFADAELRQEVYQRVIMPMASQVEQYLQAHVDSGAFRQVNPMIVTRAMMGALVLNSAIKLSQIDPRYDNISANAMIEQFVSLFMNGLLQGDENG